MERDDNGKNEFSVKITLDNMADKPLILNAPRTGIAQSPNVGIGDCRNLDIDTTLGVVKLNNILAKVSTTAVTATVKWIVRDPVTTSKAYAVDSSGDVYVGTLTGSTWAWIDLGTQPTNGGAGQGLAIWKDYLFCARATAVDLYDIANTTWHNSWAGLTMTTDSLWHPMLVSKLDDKLYIGSGRYIDSVAEVSGQNFTWNTGGTYTATASALTLPEDYRVKCLAEQGNNLMIGTWMGTNIYDNRIADIFPWDGSSVTYGKPIIMGEFGVNAMTNIGGYLYILAGIDGDVYKSNGVQAWKIAQIPQTLADISGGKYFEPYPGAIANYKSKLFFSLSSSATAGKIISDGVGIYSLVETSNGNILNFEHSISEGVMGSANPTIIGALLPTSRDTLLVGWRNHTTYGIDATTATSYAYGTDYSGYFESPLYQIGSNLANRQFTEAEFQLVKDLATNEGIQISYRLNLTDSFTVMDTYTFAILGAITSHNTGSKGINILGSDKIQFKVGLKGTTTTPEFRNLILK